MPKKKKTTKKRSSRRTSSRKRPSKKAKVASKRNTEKMLFVIAAVLVVCVIILSVPSENFDDILNDQEQERTAEQMNVELGVLYPCERNLECFLVGCKSTGITECVNTVAQETYYKNCEDYTDVSVARDSTRCACVQGLCKLIS